MIKPSGVPERRGRLHRSQLQGGLLGTATPLLIVIDPHRVIFKSPLAKNCQAEYGNVRTQSNAIERNRELSGVVDSNRKQSTAIDIKKENRHAHSSI